MSTRAPKAQCNVRLDAATIARADALIGDDVHGEATRSSVLRRALILGLEEIERRRTPIADQTENLRRRSEARRARG